MMLEWWMHNWERKLVKRDTNRVVRPMTWGVEHVGMNGQNSSPSQFLHQFVDQTLSDSEPFFTPPASTEYSFSHERLSFPSPIQSPHPENDTAYARLFPAASHGRAVIVLPQWNADAQGHVGLCRLLNRVGVSALRMCLPYHESRKPAHLERAEYLISANIGLTIQAVRQAVLETRLAADWLQRQGFTKLGIIGTSIGSCIAFLAFAHDERFHVGVFNHASSYFADVVWTGLTTQHVRQGIEPHVSLEELRRFWSVISPQTFVSRLQGTHRKSLMISARYDLSFLPSLTEQFFQELRRYSVPFDRFTLPCGHYTSGVFPFKYLDGLAIANYFRRHLAQLDRGKR
jgi:hypothetical protein